MGDEVYDQEAVCVEYGKECCAEPTEVFVVAVKWRECLGLMGVEQQHESRSASTHAFGQLIVEVCEAFVLDVAWSHDGSVEQSGGRRRGCFEPEMEIFDQKCGRIVARRVNDHDRVLPMVTARLFEICNDGFLGWSESPAKVFREAVAPYVGAVWLAREVGCYEPSVVHMFFAQNYGVSGCKRCDNDAEDVLYRKQRRK